MVTKNPGNKSTANTQQTRLQVNFKMRFKLMTCLISVILLLQIFTVITDNSHVVNLNNIALAGSTCTGSAGGNGMVATATTSCSGSSTTSTVSTVITTNYSVEPTAMWWGGSNNTGCFQWSVGGGTAQTNYIISMYIVCPAGSYPINNC